MKRRPWARATIAPAALLGAVGEPVAGADVTVTVRATDAEQAIAIRAEERPQGGVYQVSHRFATPSPDSRWWS